MSDRIFFRYFCGLLWRAALVLALCSVSGRLSAQAIEFYGTPQSGIAGWQYRCQLAAFAQGNLTWRVVSGSLPTGLQLTTTGLITGAINASAAGTWNFRAEVTSSAGGRAERDYTLTAFNSPQTQLRIFNRFFNPPLPNAPTELPLEAIGGTPPYRWERISGTLPAGMTLSPLGRLSGIPTGAGSAVLRVTDSTGASQNMNLDIGIFNSNFGIVTSSSVMQAVVGAESFSDGRPILPPMTVIGGTPPYRWTVTGNLPTGVTLNSATGAFSGAPTANGSFGFLVTVEDARGLSDAIIASILVVPPSSLTTPTPPDAEVGRPYDFTLRSSGGMAPIHFYAANANFQDLPNNSPAPGLTIDRLTGRISGTPTSAGDYTFTVRLLGNNSYWESGGIYQFQRDVRLRVAGPVSPLTITTAAALPTGAVGVPYSQTLAATGGRAPYTWRSLISALPPGLSLSTAGVLAGTPANVGTYFLNLEVRDADGRTATRNFAVTFSPAAPTLTLTSSRTLPGAAAGAPYSVTLQASGGQAPYTWILAGGTLPGGMSMNPSSGVLSGTPAAAGNFNFRIQVRDAAGRTAEDAFSLAVTASAPRLTFSQAPSANPASQTRLAFSLTGTFPSALTGSIRMTFTPSADVNANDGGYLFSNGRRDALVNVAANSTTVNPADANLAVQNGTTAGRVVIELISLTPAGSSTNLIPSPQVLADYTVGRSRPVISGVTVVNRNATGITLRIRGYTTTRSLTTATFTFNVRSGTLVTESPQPVPLGNAAATFFQNQQISAATGGQFNYDQVFSVAGAAGGDGTHITSITVRIANSTGESETVTVN